MSLARSLIAYFKPLAPSTKAEIERINPTTLQELWDGLIDGRDMLRMWQLDSTGDDRDKAPLPEALNRLIDDLYLLPTNSRGTQTLRDDLIDEFGINAYNLMLSGEQEPPRPVDPRSYLQDLWRIALDFTWANRDLAIWFRLNSLVGKLRNYYHSVPDGPNSNDFDKRLANLIRERQPVCPLSWMPATSFLCIYSVDTSEDASLGDYTPSDEVMAFFDTTESDDNTSELAYLDEDDETTWSKGKHRKWVGELPFWAFDEMMRTWNFGIHDEHGSVMVGIGETYPCLSANPYRPMSHHHAAQDMSVTPFPPFDPPKTAEEEQAVWEWLTKTLKGLYP